MLLAEGGCRLPSSGNGCSAEFLSPWPASRSSGLRADGQGLCGPSVNSSWSRGEGSRVDMECPGPRDLEGPEAGPFPRRLFSVSTGSLRVALGGPRQGLRRPLPRGWQSSSVERRLVSGWDPGVSVAGAGPWLRCQEALVVRGAGAVPGSIFPSLSLLYLPLHLSLQASPRRPCSSAPAGRPLPSSRKDSGCAWATWPSSHSHLGVDLGLCPRTGGWKGQAGLCGRRTPQSPWGSGAAAPTRARGGRRLSPRSAVSGALGGPRGS